jgi:hypothetical protein
MRTLYNAGSFLLNIRQVFVEKLLHGITPVSEYWQTAIFISGGEEVTFIDGGGLLGVNRPPTTDHR